MARAFGAGFLPRSNPRRKSRKLKSSCKIFRFESGGPAMKSAVWNKAIKESAAPERARTYFEALARNNRAVEKASAQEARILCALFSGSQVLSDRLSSHPELLEVLAPENLAHPRRAQGLRRETQRRLQPFQAAS